jgi:hypothetical protein
LDSRRSHPGYGSLGRVFSERTSADLDRNFTVFNARDLEEELRPLATDLIADHVWREVRRHPRPRMLLIDEAWSVMRHPAGARLPQWPCKRQAQKGAPSGGRPASPYPVTRTWAPPTSTYRTAKLRSAQC